MSAQPTERGEELAPPTAVTEGFPAAADRAPIFHYSIFTIHYSLLCVPRKAPVDETPDGELRRRRPPKRARDALYSSAPQKPLTPLKGELAAEG